MERDHWQCVICGSGLDDGKNLQCHHILYLKRDPWDYPDYLYQTLCEDCHEHRTELTDKAVNAVRIAVARTATPLLVQSVKLLCAKAMLEIEVEV